MYSSNNQVVCRLALSPSMGFNNLCYSSGQLIFTRRNAAVIVDAASVLVGGDPQILDHKQRPLARYVQVPIKSGWTVYEARQFVIHGEPLLVIAAVGGIQIFDSEQRSLFVWAFPPNETLDSKVDVHHCRGLALVTSADGMPCILSGSSNGNVHIFAVEGRRKFLHTGTISVAADSITCLTGDAAQSSSSHTVVIGDRSGSVHLYKLSNCGTLKHVGSHKLDAPIATVGLKDRVIAVGAYSGVVSLFEESASGMKLYCELTTCTRMLTSMTLHPTRNWLVTGSEDSTIAVWQYPRPGDRDVQLLFTAPWRGCPVTGVTFFGDHVVAVPYDQEEAVVYKFQS